MAPRSELAALHLCSGYGGWELALRPVVRARTVCHVEWDAYAASILVERMGQARLDQAPIWSDVTTFDGRPWRGRVDLITAGFPCQPFSSAGKQRGVDDARWLWPQIARIISEVGPSYVLLENVPGLIRRGLPQVLADLADLGFNAEWGCLTAAAVGATHERNRVGVLASLADSQGFGQREPHLEERPFSRERTWQDAGRRSERMGQPPGPRAPVEHWAEWLGQGGPEPVLRRSSHGRPLGLADALHLGGNGMVPAWGTEIVRQLADRMMAVLTEGDTAGTVLDHIDGQDARA